VSRKGVLEGVLFGLAAALGSASAEASPSGERGAVYDVDVAVDLAATLSMALVSSLLDHTKHEWNGVSPCQGRGHAPSAEDLAAIESLPENGGACDASDVEDLDRSIIGNDSDAARRLSDLLLLAMLAAPLAYAGGEAAFSDVEGRGRRFGEDVLVAYEAMAATNVLTNVIKLAVQRPRPFTYDPKEPMNVRFDGDARLSFLSGHASLTFAAATAIAFTGFRRHDGLEPWIAATSAYALAGFAAYLRTAAGKHFVTDVLAGAALGVVTGLVIAHIHLRDTPNDSSSARASGLSGEASRPDSRHDGARPWLLTLQGAF
jgi:membrane-associated phospholipid phosphatase